MKTLYLKRPMIIGINYLYFGQTGNWHKVGSRHKLYMLPKVGQIQLDDNTLKGKHVRVVATLVRKLHSVLRFLELIHFACV